MSNKQNQILLHLLKALPYQLKGAIEGVIWDDIFEEHVIPDYLQELSNMPDFSSFRTLLIKSSKEIKNLRY